MKRERVLNAHRTSDLYMQFQSIKHKIDVDFAPETPKPSSYSNKRGWEKAMFIWKCALKNAVSLHFQCEANQQQTNQEATDELKAHGGHADNADPCVWI